jgi:hypothetical protein
VLLPFGFAERHYVLTQYSGWLRHLLADDRQILPVELWYRDFRLLCHVAGLPLSRGGYLVIELFAAGAIASLCFIGWFKSWTEKRLLLILFVLSCCWMTVLGPATESCTYILLAPALAWTFLNAWTVSHPPWLRISVLFGYALFTLTQMAPWFPVIGRQFHSLAPHPLAGLVLCACFLAMELRNDVR